MKFQLTICYFNVTLFNVKILTKVTSDIGCVIKLPAMIKSATFV